MGKIKVGCLIIITVVFTDQAAVWAQQKVIIPKPGSVSVAILPIDVKGLDPSLGAKITGTVMGQLEKIGVLKVPTTNVSANTFNQLQKKKIMIESCSNRPWCIQTVATAFNAKVVYHVVAAKAQGGVTLTMRIFDAKTGKEMRKAVEFATEEASEIERAARWASLTVSSPVVSSLMKGKGKLLVDCSESGADLSINGKSFGKKTGKSFKVSAGVFDVIVRKDGFVPYRDVLMIRPEENQVIKAALISETNKAVAAAPTKSNVVRSPGEVPPPLSVESQKEQPRKEELPAWAVFESQKETGRVGQPAFAKKPEVEKAAAETPKEGQKKFYQTWWFWTIVGVAVVGGVTAGLILGLPKDETATGSATITWK